MFLINNGVSGKKYNIVGEKEVNNLEMAQFISKVIGKELISCKKRSSFNKARSCQSFRISV